MSNKLYNGLLDVGGILTETYYRKTKATVEAKEALGYEAGDTPNASIGISQVREFITVTSPIITKNNNHLLVGTNNNQHLILESLYTSNPNVDRFKISLLFSNGEEYYQQTINKTQQVSILPKLIIPVRHQLVVFPTSGDMRFTANFRLCAALDGDQLAVVSNQEDVTIDDGGSRDSRS